MNLTEIEKAMRIVARTKAALVKATADMKAATSAHTDAWNAHSRAEAALGKLINAAIEQEA